jgi:transcriptional regulator with XRE-family HTH domain
MFSGMSELRHIGSIVRELREAAGLSQRELGELVALRQAQLSVLERMPEVACDVIQRVAEACDQTTRRRMLVITSLRSSFPAM